MSRLITPKENASEFFRNTYERIHSDKYLSKESFDDLVRMFRAKALGLNKHGKFVRLPTQRQLNFAFKKILALAKNTDSEALLSKYTAIFSLSEARVSGSPCIYEYFTREYVARLMGLLETLANIAKPDKKIKISELGAGFGHFASEIEKYYSDICDISAHDNFSWKSVIPESLPIVNAISDIPGALAQDRPDMIISSWMPWQENWVGLFPRNINCYLLIGEAFGGCCGSDYTFEAISPEWSRYDLRKITGPQLARTDVVVDDLSEIFGEKTHKCFEKISVNYPHSSSILFVRKNWRKAAEAVLPPELIIPE